MFRKVSILAAIVVVFSFCSHARAAQIPVSWDGGGDGRSWADAANWNPNIVPDNDGNTFAVTIDSGLGEVDIVLQQNRTIDTLVSYGNVQLQGEPWEWVQLTLVDANGLTNYGEFGINAWGVLLFNIKGNVTNTSGALLDLWGADISGDVNNQTGAVMEVNGEVEVYDDGNLENTGVIVIGDHELHVDQQVHNAGQITIYGGGCSSNEVLDNNSTGVIKGFGTVYGQPLRNKGQIIAFGGSLAVGSEGDLINKGVLGNYPSSSLHIKPSVYTEPAADVNNQGTIEVHAGGGVAFDCNLVNEPNGVIQLLGGSLSAKAIVEKAGATFEGFGGISADPTTEPNGIIIEPNGLIQLTGPTNIVGDVTIDLNATLEISDGTTLITGDCTCDNGTIHMIGGRIIIQGDFTNNNCNIIWEPGTYTNVADFNLDGTVNFKDYADFANTWLWKANWY